MVGRMVVRRRHSVGDGCSLFAWHAARVVKEACTARVDIERAEEG